MTPGARVAAAIAILDEIESGTAAEKALTNWGRSSRFAGAKDRAAVRDHVYDVVRCKRSAAAIGGGTSGRALMIGMLAQLGQPLDALFHGEGHAPAALSEAETAHIAGQMSMSDTVAADMPDILWPMWQADLGDMAMPAALAQRQRAPLYLRVNTARATCDNVIASLMADGVVAVPHQYVHTALEVTENPRKVQQSVAFDAGLIEVQDAASQQAMLALDLAPGTRVLDYCAGGGGKALALADYAAAQVTAHDIDPRRMRDIPARAARAGVTINTISTAKLAGLAPFDLVLVDAPCSGSGTWRRSPEAKWLTDLDKIHDFNRLQCDVLEKAAAFVSRSGGLAYATCSVFNLENDQVVAHFLSQNADWKLLSVLRLLPDTQHDGFYLARLARA